MILGSRNEVPALLPRACAVGDRRGEERIELGAGRRVDAIRAGSPVTLRRIILRGFDRGKVCLESYRRVVLCPVIGQRAGEQERAGMHLAVLAGNGVGPWPVILVRLAVPVQVR